MSGSAVVLILTSIFPDSKEQQAHDNSVKEWLGKNAMTVLDVFGLPDAPLDGSPEERMEWLVNKIQQLKPEMLDCSIDHYWRDVLEEATGLAVTHHPYPVK